VPRQYVPGAITSFQPVYVNPWYAPSSSLYFGYSSYDPFFYGYGYNRWNWSRYGLWYDPYYSPFDAYGPLYLDPGMYGYPGSYYGFGGYGGSYSNTYSSPRESERNDATGSIRLRVKPSNAQVYLDGTLMGVVDQFDGLTTHLAAPAGTHELQIRADGYDALTMSVNVKEDRTVTARGNLKKK
jgi:hypothetical protein